MSTLMQYLLACNVLDIVTGFLRAYDQKNISSKKIKHGALSKISIWCIIAVSMIVSSYLKTDLTTYVTGYYLIMEVVSIFENVSVFVPVPDKLKNILEIHTTQKETENDTVTTADPDIVKFIEEQDKKLVKSILILQITHTHMTAYIMTLMAIGLV